MLWYKVGDITKISADAIVNAANTRLLGGGGVDGAIHQAAGSELLAATAKLGGCPVGQSRITSGFQLSARFVIHTVGPVWRGGNHEESAQLASCYRTALDLAEEWQLQSVAFPAISTGIYGYPMAEAAEIALGAVSRHPTKYVQDIIFVLYSSADYLIYKEVAAKLGIALSWWEC
ncbi:MAG: O-acetyl-ADP-ribose deacetylase [Firmicutes bacterium]|nr:O-acetyl-ADP-ribose deacetylase [Bacillota bacterium]